ncbi:hypothetical protein DCAR_0208882 [Daucus carota subsp. sativus]|uniref:F-box domain-containing protein n=2 Tax=Daucus carota subsp. sativus TaxID=79200 RepID=A0A166EV68_DAUCS|nr:hypothetical protein DCAR_0208882 [Daucus carota subsp. sativus]
MKNKKRAQNPNCPNFCDDVIITDKISKPRIKRKQRPNWLQLPYDVTINIFRKLGAVEILLNARKVCKAWHNICKEPFLWIVTSMHHDVDYGKFEPAHLDLICMAAVDRSQGQLLDVSIEFLATRTVMNYIAQRSSQLSRLRLVNCHYYLDRHTWNKFLERVPLLEELSLKFSGMPGEAIEDASRHCPMLTTIKIRVYDKGCHPCLDVVLAAAMGMTQLRHLQLSGYVILRRHLEAIISSGCTHLESLDLTGCFSARDIISLSLREKCIAQIENIRFPADWMGKFMGEADWSEMED